MFGSILLGSGTLDSIRNPFNPWFKREKSRVGREWLGCGHQLKPPGTEPSWSCCWGEVQHGGLTLLSGGVLNSSGPWLLSPPKAASSTAAPGSVSMQPRLCGHGGSLGGRTCLAVLARLSVAAAVATHSAELPSHVRVGTGSYRHGAGSGTAPGEAAFRQSRSKGTSLQVGGLMQFPAAELCPAPSQLPMWDGDV